MLDRYDLVIIGAGPGGYEAALRAAELGLRTALVEKREIGGTCLNRGCVPTKTLLHTAELVSAARQAQAYGVSVDAGRIDMDAIHARRKAVSQELREGVSGLLESAGVEVFRGRGTVCGTGLVKVAGEEERTLETENVLLATGLVPARPPVPGLDLPGVVTSDDVIEGPAELFDSLTIIGGGVIGVELAVFYRKLGCRVTILEGLDRLLPNLDRELGQNLVSSFRKMGMEICTKAMVSAVRREGGRMFVDFAQRDKQATMESEKVLCAIGRTPDLTGLFAPGLEPRMNRKLLAVDDRFQTSIPGVYAVGDVCSKIQLAHMAAAQGRACAELLAGKTPETDLRLIPCCVYCEPDIACVGYTADEAKEAGFAAVSGKYVMYANARTLILDGPRSFIKLVADADSRKLLGAQLMCENATDMISQFTQALKEGLTVDEMLRIVRPHPTFEEGTMEALRNLRARLSAPA